MGLFSAIKNKFNNTSDAGLDDSNYDRYLSDYKKKRRRRKKDSADFWADIPDNDGVIYTPSSEGLSKQDEAYSDEDKDIDIEVAEHKKLQAVSVVDFSEPDMIEYIRGQCEVMEDATRHIDKIMQEYNKITANFADIELYNNAPDNLKKQIADAAEMVDNLTVDRRIIKSGEAKLSNNAYRRMEQYEDELPAAIRMLNREEAYYDDVYRSLRTLESEQYSLRSDARALKKKQINIRHSCISMLACFGVVYAIFIVATLATQSSFNMFAFYLVTVLGAGIAIGSFALMEYTKREVVLTEIKLNKITNGLNKIKIRYVNSANLLDYEYNKYKVSNCIELEKKYNAYLEMKAEQLKILKMTQRLNEVENELVRKLDSLGMKDSMVWLGQAKALYNPKEMVEVRHDLSVGRQKLREQIEYNEKRIISSKGNIKKIMEKYPQYMKATMEILDEFEKRNSNKKQL